MKIRQPSTMGVMPRATAAGFFPTLGGFRKIAFSPSAINGHSASCLIRFLPAEGLMARLNVSSVLTSLHTGNIIRSGVGHWYWTKGEGRIGFEEGKVKIR
jgi:hypothetical protein